MRFGQILKQTQNDFLHLAHSLRGAASLAPSLLSQLDLTNRNRTTHHMRDGEVVLYLRPASRVWQVRYKLFDRKWRCVSTKQRQLEWAINVVHEADGFTGLNSALSGRHDAIVLDVVLPLLGGFEVLQELRKRQIFTPVVMLSASADLQDKLKSFNLGALDYVPKPFHLEELAARLKLVVELKQDKFEKAISHGGVTLDRFRREVIWQERATLLTQREFSLLECLMQSPGQIFSKQKILQRVWKIDFETGRTTAIRFFCHH